jgi:hypothetical protein
MKGESTLKVQKIDNINENRANLRRGRDLQQKGEITLSKNKSRTAQFRAVLDDVVLKGVKTR